MRTSSRAAVLAVCVLATAWSTSGCEKKDPLAWQKQAAAALQPVIEKHRPTAQAKIDALKAIALEAGALPPVEAREGAALPVTPKATLFSPNARSEKGNALLVNVETLAGGADAADGVRLAKGTWIKSLERYLTSGWYDSGNQPPYVDQKFEELAGLKLALVARVHQYKAPSLVVAGGEQRFEAGRARGDVLIYDIDERKRLGAFPFEVVQRDTASVNVKGSSESAARELEENFRVDLNASLRKELAAFVDGAAGPASPGIAKNAAVSRFAERMKVELASFHLVAGIQDIQIDTTSAVPRVTLIADKTGPLLSGGSVKPEVVEIARKVLGAESPIVEVKQAAPAGR